MNNINLPTPNEIILIVDDSIDNIRLLSTMLSAQGYTVKKAVSGKFALQALDVITPDLILLDINMPEMNGWEFLDAIAEAASLPQRFPKIYMLSSSLDPADKVRAETHQFVAGFLSKPLESVELEFLAHVVLEKK